MKRWLVVWLWASIVLPAVFGLGMAANPAAVVASNPATSLVWMVAIRQVVYSGVLLAAWKKAGPVAAAMLLFGRGATDLLDGVTTLATNPAAAAMGAVPVVLGLVSFFAGAVLLRGGEAR